MTRNKIIEEIKKLNITDCENNYENLKEWLYLNGTRLYNVVGISVEREDDEYITCQIHLVDGRGESFGSVQYSFYRQD